MAVERGKRMRVRCGEITIGAVELVHDKQWAGYRVSAGGLVQVGTATTQVAAINMVAQSLIHKSMENGSGLDPARRAKLQEALELLDVAGLKEVSNLIRDAIK